jgi:hypothetical protein
MFVSLGILFGIGQGVVAGVEPPAEGEQSPTVITAELGMPHFGSPFPITVRENDQWSPAVAYNWKHREYLVVWQDAHEQGIYAQRVSSQGKLVGPNPIHIASGPNVRYDPDVAYDPVNDRYLVVWGHLGNLSGRLIPWEHSDPALPEFQIVAWPNTEDYPEVTYNRTNEQFLVVWWNIHNGMINGRLVNADGGFPIDPNAGFLTLSNSPSYHTSPDVVHNRKHNDYLVGFNLTVSVNQYDVYASRIHGSDGYLFDPDVPVATGTNLTRNPTVAVCPEVDQYFIAWEEEITTVDSDIYARFMSGDGWVEAGIRIIAFSPDKEKYPAVTCNQAGDQYLVGWTIVPSADYLGRIVNSQGEMSPTFQIGFSGEEAAGGHPGYLAVWVEETGGPTPNDIFGRLVIPEVVFLPMITR